jgi:RND family efflux transporter MFP subunit
VAEPTTTDEPTTASWVISILVSLAILGGAAFLLYTIFTTEPTAKKGGATKKTAMLVDVVEVDRGSYRPQIVAQGTVEPARDIELRPQVGGKVTSVADELTPGGHVEAGERLLQIEAQDFRNTLAQRKSELRQAETELAVERGRHDAAKAEYDYLSEKDLPPKNKSLLLREPQLEAAKQRVNAAKAAVDQARLNLRRTSVEAPFDAKIVRRDVNLGSQISPSDSIARLIGTETYWVGVELPLSKLRYVSVDRAEDEGSIVEIRNRQAWPADSHRSGRLYKKVGVLDEDTRMARVLAAIPDPLALEDDKPELVVGEFVEVTIAGNEMKDAVRLDRDYVREDETVWVMEDEKLRIRDVDIAVRDARYAYITDGLADGAKVVTTNISTVTDGAALRLDGAGQGSEDDDNSEEGDGE